MFEKYSDKIRGAVRDVYDSISSEFDQTRRRQWAELEDLVDYVDKGDRVLDLGCGNGRLFELCPIKTSTILVLIIVVD